MKDYGRVLRGRNELLANAFLKHVGVEHAENGFICIERSGLG